MIFHRIFTSDWGAIRGRGLPAAPADICRSISGASVFFGSAALHTALKLVQGDNTILVGVQLPEHILQVKGGRMTGKKDKGVVDMQKTVGFDIQGLKFTT